MREEISAYLERRLDTKGDFTEIDKEATRVLNELAAERSGPFTRDEVVDKVMSYPNLSIQIYARETKRNTAIALQKGGGEWISVYLRGDISEKLRDLLSEDSQDSQDSQDDAIEWLEIAHDLQTSRGLSADSAIAESFEEKCARTEERRFLIQKELEFIDKVLPVMEKNPGTTVEEAVKILESGRK